MEPIVMSRASRSSRYQRYVKSSGSIRVINADLGVCLMECRSILESCDRRSGTSAYDDRSSVSMYESIFYYIWLHRLLTAGNAPISASNWIADNFLTSCQKRLSKIAQADRVRQQPRNLTVSAVILYQHKNTWLEFKSINACVWCGFPKILAKSCTLY